MKLTFVQTATFASKAKKLDLTDEDLQELEALLMKRPEAGATVAGTGGVRKIRFAPSSWATGKSGATRVIYAHIVVVEHVYLMTVYAKNEQENLSAEQKAALQAVMQRIKAAHGVS